MKSSIFALTFALALVQFSSAQESVDSSDEIPTRAYPTFMPSASPVGEDPFASDAPYSASVPPPVPTFPFVSGAPRPSASGVPHFSGSALPPCPSVTGVPHPTGSMRRPRSSPVPTGSAGTARPSVTCVNPSAPVGTVVPSYSGMPPQPSHSSKSRSRPHRTTFPVDLPSFSPQPSDGPYPTGI